MMTQRFYLSSSSAVLLIESPDRSFHSTSPGCIEGWMLLINIASSRSCSRAYRFKMRLIFPVLQKSVSYSQGQYRGKIREYFYFIDHNGMLFQDDTRFKNFTSCFKDLKFLNFFYNRLKVNDSGFHQDEFPYVSPCGREQNYVRVDDLPVVFTKLIGEDCDTELIINGSDLRFPFHPSKAFMDPNSGRIYHAGPDKLHGVGLLSSKLAIQLSSRCVMMDGACKYFRWKGQDVPLTGEVEVILNSLQAPHRAKLKEF